MQASTESVSELSLWPATGFHGLEEHAGQPYHWLERRACLQLAAHGGGFVELLVWCDHDDLSQHLSIDCGGAAQTQALLPGWGRLSIALPAGATELRLETDRCLEPSQHPGDARELALRIRPPQRHADPARHQRALDQYAVRLARLAQFLASPLGPLTRSAREVSFEDGFHPPEQEAGVSFRWMSLAGRVRFPPAAAPRYLELQVQSQFHDLRQTLCARVAGAEPAAFPLVSGWNHVSIVIPAGAAGIELEANEPIPLGTHRDDRRVLSVLVRWPLLHAEPARHAHIVRQQDNRVLNLRETLSGAVRLESSPWKLGIDIVGSCNVKPPCVYCQWDYAKSREGSNVDAAFDTGTLAELGPFFDNATDLVNCSIGEPFMLREIDPLLDAFGSRGKVLEMTTNGQILTERNVQKLLGRNAHLYISLDAATAPVYAQLRNDTFPRLLANVKRLVEAKGGRGNLPLVYLVFMPMRANVHEVDAFVALVAELGADRLVLRPLNPADGTDLVWDRAGYHFDYQKELLPFDELVRVSGRVAELCRHHDVALSDQMDFGGGMALEFQELYEQGRAEARAAIAAWPAASLAQQQDPAETPLPVIPAPREPAAPPPPAPPDSAPPALPLSLGEEKLPICTEPWSSLYVLRRGTLPCCYGGPVLAPMSEHASAWNAPLMQELRRELAAGRFHQYCFDSPDCPIVRKARAGARLGPAQNALFLARRAFARLRRAGWGLPGRLYRESKARARRTPG